MALNSMGNYATLSTVTGDAFKNIFDVEFTRVPEKLKNTSESLGEKKFRINAISIPETSVGVADIRIRGTIIKKISGAISQGNDLVFEIRIDNQWEYYKLFLDWRNLYGDRKTGVRQIYDDSTKETGEIVVTSECADGKIAVWTFHDVVLFGVGELGFDHSVGDPIAVNLQMNYSYYDFKIRGN